MVLLADGGLLLRLLGREQKGPTHQHRREQARCHAAQGCSLASQHDRGAVTDISRQHGCLR